MSHDPVKYRERAESDRQQYGTSDPRKIRRIERKIFGKQDHVYSAHCLGQYDAHVGNPYRNPYPKGKRYDAYAGGYSTIGAIK